MDWLSSFSTFSFWANVGSVAGAAFTFVAFFYQLSLSKRYALLIRGPELIEDLTEIGSDLNDYDGLSSQEQKTVLNKTRTLLRSSVKHLRWRRRIELWPTQISLWWNWKSAAPEKVEDYYAQIQRVSVALDIRIRNRQVEQ